MDCVACGSAAVTERPERTARCYRRFRCHGCGRRFNERSGTLLNHAQYPSDVIALVVLWRLRYRLTLRDLSEMFLQRGTLLHWSPAWVASGRVRPGRAPLTLQGHPSCRSKRTPLGAITSRSKSTG